MNKIVIHACALALGALAGTLIFRTAAPARVEFGNESAANGVRKTARAGESAGVRISRLIAAEGGASFAGNVPVNQVTDNLFAQRKSPMRTRAFLKHRIQSMSKDQLIQALANGEILTKEELAEAGRRLGREAPEEGFDRLERDLRIGDLENFYTINDALMNTWADHDAPAVLARLKKMKRGGSQQDRSLRFSDYWADTDPAAAASHFQDIIYLRNMHDEGTDFTDDVYAGRIVRSWKRKDEAALRGHVDGLPAGRERDAFEKALTASDAGKR